MTAARWDGARWQIETSGGPFSADVLITACGQLSQPSIPPLPGLGDFGGEAFHTAQWRHDVPLAGKRVAVIGSGCSAVQVVPAIADEVASLAVYQRSPAWTIPPSSMRRSSHVWTSSTAATCRPGRSTSTR